MDGGTERGRSVAGELGMIEGRGEIRDAAGGWEERWRKGKKIWNLKKPHVLDESPAAGDKKKGRF